MNTNYINNKHSFRLKSLAVRLIAILVVECFVISNIAPDYQIRSLANLLKADFRQAKNAFVTEAPDAYLDIGSLSGSPLLSETALHQVRALLNQEVLDFYSYFSLSPV
jgi:hypothetical protein